MKSTKLYLLFISIFCLSEASLCQTFQILKTEGNNVGEIYKIQENYLNINNDIALCNSPTTDTSIKSTYGNFISDWPGFASDSDYYYYYSPTLGRVERTGKDGSNNVVMFDASEVFGDDYTAYEGFAADNNYFYFLGNVNNTNPLGSIERVNKDGTNRQTIVQGLPFGAVHTFKGFATDGIHFYFLNNTANTSWNGIIHRLSMDGTNKETVVDLSTVGFESGLTANDIEQCKGFALDTPKLSFDLGATVQHLYQYGNNTQDRTNLIRIIDDAGVKMVRMTMQLLQSPDEQHRLIREFNQKGIKVLLVITPGSGSLYIDGAQRRDTCSSGQGSPYKLSELAIESGETNNFSCGQSGISNAITCIDEYFDNLQNSPEGPGYIDAVEVLNESNWSSFNGDLPCVDGGQMYTICNTITNTEWNESTFKTWREGIRKLGKLTKLVRTSVHTRFGNKVKIISAGLINSYDAEHICDGDSSAATQDLTLNILKGSHPQQNANDENYLNYVDAIGMHFYPKFVSGSLPLSEHIDLANKQVVEGLRYSYSDVVFNCLNLNECVGTNLSTISDLPIWITEYGYKKCKFNDCDLPGSVRNDLSVDQQNERHFEFVSFLNALERINIDGCDNINVNPIEAAFAFQIQKSVGHQFLDVDETLHPVSQIFNEFTYPLNYNPPIPGIIISARSFVEKVGMEITYGGQTVGIINKPRLNDPLRYFFPIDNNKQLRVFMRDQLDPSSLSRLNISAINVSGSEYIEKKHFWNNGPKYYDPIFECQGGTHFKTIKCNDKNIAFSTLSSLLGETNNYRIVNNFEVYPSVVSDEFFINYEHLFDMSIFDLNGNLVLTETQLSGLSSLDVLNISSGIYFVRLTDENGYTESHKFVKL